MKAVVLAAGEGKRMHPLTHTRPKVMLPIANRPILEHLLIEMRRAGVREFMFVVGYQDETIRRHFQNGEAWDAKIQYATQRKQLGTAHALTLARDFAGDRFLLANGDVVVRARDIGRVLEKDNITLTLVEAEETSGLGVVEIEDGKVKAIHEKVEKPPSNLVNAGLYLMTPEIFSALDRTRKSPRGEYEVTDSLQMLLDDGYVLSWVAIDHWLDVSYPWNLLAANEALMANIVDENLGEVEENVLIKGPVSIGQGTVVRSGSYIVGPVVLGADCDVGPSCYIRPCTAVGDNCHLGSFVEVKNSIIMHNTKIPHHNYVGDSVIGANCNLGSGTKIANLRLDRGNVTVASTDTGRRKLGAIIGDGVQTGINANINVGAVIGNNTLIGPGATARGVILPNSSIF